MVYFQSMIFQYRITANLEGRRFYEPILQMRKLRLSEIV